MREVLQSLRAASVEVADVVEPRPGAGHLLIRTAASIVSAGTERMLVDFARAGLLGKARQQPQRVREVAEKVRVDGVGATVDAVRSRLEEPLVLGYANAGWVVAVGPGVAGFQIGDLVASNGPHAEVVSVPFTLCAPVPKGVVPEEAAFASLGAIALQGIRLAAPTLGERFVVTGLGLIGLLAVQLLRAHGCEVLGIDPDERRLGLAEKLGADVVPVGGDALDAAARFSRHRAVDGVLVTASTNSSGPIHDAAKMCRKRGRIVLVGVTGLELQRSDFYEKELSFQVSCSYGPGRYDHAYEERAQDYPEGFVRWTAGRNMEAVLDMVATKRLDVGTLITHRFGIEKAVKAYETLTGDSEALGIVIEYPEVAEVGTKQLVRPTVASTRTLVPVSTPRVGVIGAGQFASAVMLPALRATGADITLIAARGGTSASVMARRFGTDRATNDAEEVIRDPNVDVVVILTRHDTHADLVERALDAGKHVFVEKPLAIDRDGLERVMAAWNRRAGGDRPAMLGVGFNRRFACVTQRMTELLSRVPGPRAVSITVNAGAVPPGHWTRDPAIGGGRLLGEGCHFVDLARHLTGSRIVDVSTAYLDRGGCFDSASITLKHADGSVSNIGYFTNGSRRYPKERVTVFAGGRVLVNENFRTMSAYGWHGRHGVRLLRQDKGHFAEMAAFMAAVKGDQPTPIPFTELVEVTAASLLAIS